MYSNYLTVHDPRSGKTIKIPIDPKSKTIPGTVFTQLKLKPTCPPAELPDDLVPLRLYDPGYKNTTVCRSKVSHIDVEAEKLYYRGYDVEELVERGNFLETAFLIIYGRLPDAAELENWTNAIMRHTYLHSELEKQMSTFRFDAHPHGMLIATIASLSTFHPEANPALHGVDLYLMPKVPAGREPTEEEAEKMQSVRKARNRAINRIIGKVATIAANCYNHRLGRPYNHPMPKCSSYAENLLYMMDRLNEDDYRPDPRLIKILDKMFIVLAENGSACSTVLMRHLTSSGVDPYTALSGAAGALFGERKASAVIHMLQTIAKPEKIQLFLSMVKRKETDASKLGNTKVKFGGSASDSASKLSRPLRLMGFGHRIYKRGDPRVHVIRTLAFELFELMGRDDISELAIQVEEAVHADEWFTQRSLYANSDYWTAIVFHTVGFPEDMFPVLMTVPRAVGFLAHCLESLDDPEFKIFRPRQIYIGCAHRPYTQLPGRSPATLPTLSPQYVSSDPVAAKRRLASDQLDSTTAEELEALIAEAQRSLEDLNSKLGKDKEDTNSHENGLDKLSSGRLAKWIGNKMFASSQQSLAGRLALEERLRDTQQILSKLLERQRELFSLQQHHTQGMRRSGSGLDQRGSREASMSRGDSISRAKSPDLLAGKSTSRVILEN
ncbi:citrate synthase-like protein [Gaertneriomyces semiglobifer]|nr:citrate synthase-like protein [Gaertneriomyces semiglobifer]